LDLESNQ